MLIYGNSLTLGDAKLDRSQILKDVYKQKDLNNRRRALPGGCTSVLELTRSRGAAIAWPGSATGANASGTRSRWCERSPDAVRNGGRRYLASRGAARGAEFEREERGEERRTEHLPYKGGEVGPHGA